MEQNLEPIRSKIYEIRGQRVMLDRDLAELYGVQTKVLNQAVKRNIRRFEGDDFMFRLTKDEAVLSTTRSQTVTMNRGRGHNSSTPSVRHWRSCSPGSQSHGDASGSYRRKSENYYKEQRDDSNPVIET